MRPQNALKYLPHGNLRFAVMGHDFRRQARRDEIVKMQALVKAD